MHHNFYRGAKSGLASELVWPQVNDQSVCTRRTEDLIPELTQIAQQGLDTDIYLRVAI